MRKQQSTRWESNWSSSKRGLEGDLKTAFATLVQQRIGALVVAADPFLKLRKHEIAGRVKHGRSKNIDGLDAGANHRIQRLGNLGPGFEHRKRPARHPWCERHP